MSKILSNNEINNFLFKNKLNKESNLKNIKNSLYEAEIKYKNLKVIHVAGTNGKGSTSNYISNILIKSGYKVGMFTSPFIVCMNDRIRINSLYISNEQISIIINKYGQIMEKNKLLFFEKLVFIATVFFCSENVDYAIYEVGIGGRIDATNIFNNIINIITNISLDHTELLGNSISEIMEEKKGIIKNLSPTISSIDLGIDNIVTKNHTGDNIIFEYDFNKYSINMIGQHQIENAKIAIEASKLLKIPIKTIKEGLLSSVWEARIETLYDEPKIIIDGAHNDASIDALVNSINNKEEFTIVFSMINTKDTVILNKFNSFKRILFTNFNHPNCVNKRIMYELSNHKYKEIIDYKNIIFEKNEKYLFTGSLYFVSEVRNYIKNKKNIL